MVRSVPSQKGFEIAIIGGGIAGVCLAIGLRKRGLKTTLYEQAPGFREIGAGVFLWQNAIDAMAVLDPELVRAYNSVATKTNPLPHIKAGSIYADAHSESSLQEILFTLPPSDTTGIHRAKFLEQVVQLLPDSIVRLDKRLEDIVEDQETGHLTMTFADGTSATADVIIGCDGIKSRVRQHVVGKGHPACNAVYTHKYVYRGLIPREEANKVIREDYENRHEPDPIVRVSKVSQWFDYILFCKACLLTEATQCGKDGHIVTFPINSGTLLNLVAFHHDYNEWPDPRNTVRPATRLEMQKDFANFGRPVTELLKFSKPELDCVSGTCPLYLLLLRVFFSKLHASTETWLIIAYPVGPV